MLAAPVYAGHVRPLLAHLDEAGALVLEAPTAFEAAWIESRLGRHIRDTLGEEETATGFRVEVGTAPERHDEGALGGDGAGNQNRIGAG